MRILGLIFISFLLLAIASCDKGDSIDQARRDTKKRIKQYERTENPKELIDWLTSYHGEAPDMQVIFTFGAWGMKNQNEFLEILEAIPTEKKESLIRRIGFGIYKMGKLKSFKKAFKASKSDLVSEILKVIEGFDLTTTLVSYFVSPYV